MIEKILHRIAPFIGVILFPAALYVMHGELKSHTIAEISAGLEQLPVPVILWTLLLTGISYLILTGYDFLALRYLDISVKPGNVILASLISFSISNNTGQALISGSSMRYRFYSLWGLTGMDIIKFSLFISLMYMLGATTLFSISTVISEQFMDHSFPVAQTVQWFGRGAMAALVAYWTIILLRKKPFTVRGMSLLLPSPSLSLAQTAVAILDLVFSSLILYLFLHVHIEISFHTFLAIYIAAQILGLFSQVPGGLGVFEGAFLFLLGGSVPASSVFAALLMFRIVYYFLPLLLSGAGLLVYELFQHRTLAKKNARAVLGYLPQVVPHVFSILLVLSGGLLLVSGSVPMDHKALKWLHDILPLSVVEASHLIGSLVGLLLLFLARAVRLRIDAAYFGILLLLTIGAATSLLKGFDWREATALGILLILFLPSRHFFYRKSSLLAVPFSWTWLVFIGVVLTGSLWIGFFSYKHVEYTPDLWWQFAYKDDAPRFLRSSLLLTIVVLTYCLYRLFRVQPATAHLPTEKEIDELEPLVTSTDETQSHLALIGDKAVLWSEDRETFLMYGTTRKYWIAMGDPVGKTENKESLVWQFREMADKNRARIAFYQVSRENLPLYLDLGLVLIKLGEEARVFLQDFDLKGSKRSGLRSTNNKFSKMDLKFDILDRTQVSAQLNGLRHVSESWLLTKNANEKGFSLGFFSEEYLCRCRCGVITKADTILAFANLWETSSRQEMSIDLMRYTPDAPSGIMEYLFIQLMLWGRAQGYQWFNLGMSPLSGLEKHPLAPLWHKIGNAVFTYGDHFYNFEGLHAYKEKFDPVWRPRYLATPALTAPAVLLDVTGMIAGGWRGVFVK